MLRPPPLLDDALLARSCMAPNETIPLPSVSIASVDVTIDGFTLAKLDSFTLDTEYNYDGTIVSDYGHYCSNDARAEVLYDYDDWGECMEHCDRDADCPGGHIYYGSNDYKNLGMTVIVPERAYKNDKGFRRFDYDNIISMEVES